MKENYPNYLPYQFRLRPQSVDREPQLPNKKMKTMFLWNMSKSRRLTSTFFRLLFFFHVAIGDPFRCAPLYCSDFYPLVNALSNMKKAGYSRVQMDRGYI